MQLTFNMREIWATCRWSGLCCLGLWFSAALPAFGQAERGGGCGGGGLGGGGGGFGGGARATGAGNTSRPYYNNGTVGEAMISVDPETRRLIVITDDETGQYVGQVITNLDQPKPQVLIKVVFLEVTHNDSLDVGIEGGFQRSFGNMNTGTVANAFGLSGLNLPAGTNAPLANVFGQPTQLFGNPPPGAGLYQIMGTDYQATLRAIAQAGRTEELSRPSILARNNQPATITVGQSVPLVTSVSFNGLTGNPISTISYTPVGIILRVTPFINSEGLVEMIVSPQISQLSDQSVTVSAVVTAPVLNMRS